MIRLDGEEPVATEADLRLDHLYEISRALVGFTGVERALRNIFEIVSRTVALVSVIVIEHGSAVVSHPVLDASTPEGRLAIGHALRASAFVHANDGMSVRDDDSRFVVIPLVVAEGDSFGVIQFETTAILQCSEIELLTTIANQLAVAVDRERRVREAEVRMRQQLDIARAISASLGEGTLALDRDGVITFLNPAAAALLDIDEHAAIGLHLDVLAVIEHEDGSAVDSPTRVATQTGEWRRSDDHVLRLANGERIAIEYTSAPMRRGGVVDGAVLSIKDISERKRAERDRRFLFEATAALTTSLDADTVLATLARIGLPTLGQARFVDVLTTDHHLLRAAWTHRDPQTQAKLDALYREAPVVTTGNRPTMAVVLSGQPMLVPNDAAWRATVATSDAERALLEQVGGAYALIVPLANGRRRLGTLTFHGDAFSETDQALAEELARRGAVALEHARLYAQARDAIALRDQMLAMVSHDLRSPLSIVMLAASDLEEWPPTRPTRDTVDKIQRAAQRMDRMIRDLLDYASIEAGQFSISPRAQDVSSIVAETLVGFEGVARVRNVELAMAVPDDLPPVYCDRDRVLQVTSNLVGNALKILSSGGIVIVRAELRDEKVQISVVDTGPGIPVRDQSWLFERHWRGPHTGYPGNGLGLAIARGIARAHGGEIWVESEVGQGATFSFTLPLAAQAVPMRSAPQLGT